MMSGSEGGGGQGKKKKDKPNVLFAHSKSKAQVSTLSYHFLGGSARSRKSVLSSCLPSNKKYVIIRQHCVKLSRGRMEVWCVCVWGVGGFNFYLQKYILCAQYRI